MHQQSSNSIEPSHDSPNKKPLTRLERLAQRYTKDSTARERFVNGIKKLSDFVFKHKESAFYHLKARTIFPGQQRESIHERVSSRDSYKTRISQFFSSRKSRNMKSSENLKTQYENYSPDTQGRNSHPRGQSNSGKSQPESTYNSPPNINRIMKFRGHPSFSPSVHSFSPESQTEGEAGAVTERDSMKGDRLSKLNKIVLNQTAAFKEKHVEKYIRYEHACFQIIRIFKGALKRDLFYSFEHVRNWKTYDPIIQQKMVRIINKWKGKTERKLHRYLILWRDNSKKRQMGLNTLRNFISIVALKQNIVSEKAFLKIQLAAVMQQREANSSSIKSLRSHTLARGHREQNAMARGFMLIIEKFFKVKKNQNLFTSFRALKGNWENSIKNNLKIKEGAARLQNFVLSKLYLPFFSHLKGLFYGNHEFNQEIQEYTGKKGSPFEERALLTEEYPRDSINWPSTEKEITRDIQISNPGKRFSEADTLKSGTRCVVNRGERNQLEDGLEEPVKYFDAIRQEHFRAKAPHNTNEETLEQNYDQKKAPNNESQRIRSQEPEKLNQESTRDVVQKFNYHPYSDQAANYKHDKASEVMLEENSNRRKVGAQDLQTNRINEKGQTNPKNIKQNEIFQSYNLPKTQAETKVTSGQEDQSRSPSAGFRENEKGDIERQTSTPESVSRTGINSLRNHPLALQVEESGGPNEDNQRNYGYINSQSLPSSLATTQENDLFGLTNARNREDSDRFIKGSNKSISNKQEERSDQHQNSEELKRITPGLQEKHKGVLPALVLNSLQKGVLPESSQGRQNLINEFVELEKKSHVNEIQKAGDNLYGQTHIIGITNQKQVSQPFRTLLNIHFKNLAWTFNKLKTQYYLQKQKLSIIQNLINNNRESGLKVEGELTKATPPTRRNSNQLYLNTNHQIYLETSHETFGQESPLNEATRITESEKINKNTKEPSLDMGGNINTAQVGNLEEYRRRNTAERLNPTFSNDNFEGSQPNRNKVFYDDVIKQMKANTSSTQVPDRTIDPNLFGATSKLGSHFPHSKINPSLSNKLSNLKLSTNLQSQKNAPSDTETSTYRQNRNYDSNTIAFEDTARSSRPDLFSKRTEPRNSHQDNEDNPQDKIQPSSSRDGWLNSWYEAVPESKNSIMKSFEPAARDSETYIKRPKSISESKDMLEISKKSSWLNYSKFLESNQPPRSPIRGIDGDCHSMLKLKELDETIQKYKSDLVRGKSSEILKPKEKGAMNLAFKPLSIQEPISEESQTRMSTEYIPYDTSEQQQQQKTFNVDLPPKKLTLSLQLQSDVEKSPLQITQTEEKIINTKAENANNKLNSKKPHPNATEKLERLKQMYRGQSPSASQNLLPSKTSGVLQKITKSPKASLKLDLDKIQIGSAAKQSPKFAEGFKAGINYSIDLLKDSAKKFSTQVEEDITTERNKFDFKTSKGDSDKKLNDIIVHNLTQQQNTHKNSLITSQKQNNQKNDVQRNSNNLQSPSNSYSSLHYKKMDFASQQTSEKISSKNMKSKQFPSPDNSSPTSFEQRRGSKPLNAAPYSGLTTKEGSTREYSEYSPHFLSNVQSRKATAPEINYPSFMFRANSVQSVLPNSNDYKSFLSPQIDANDEAQCQSHDNSHRHCDLCGEELVEGTNIPKSSILVDPAKISKIQDSFASPYDDDKTRMVAEKEDLSQASSRQVSVPTSPRDQETFRRLKEKFTKNREECFDKMRKEPWLPSRLDLKY